MNNKPRHYYKRLLKRTKRTRSKMRRTPSANKDALTLIRRAVPILVYAAQSGRIVYGDETKTIEALVGILDS